MFALGLEPQSLRNPEQWPVKPIEFNETLDSYSREVRKFYKNLLKYIAIRLGLEYDFSEKKNVRGECASCEDKLLPAMFNTKPFLGS
ncbi:hypothetical protein Pint_15677 [Pistacia integerrima]|uniref:Uncharacterized protein n=1 Tax=Pistacia integerrima TaxID=434235 RepID=A0ACC0ZCX0_9ROSI|nr:hypothetical protein Pint_15677 [Pistacia integerrima]